MELSREEVERLIAWARAVFARTEESWDLTDDRLLDRLYQYQRAFSTD